MIFKGYLYSIIYAILCLALGFVLYRLCCPKTITRKVVHILVGFEWIILYHFFGGGIHLLFVCIIMLLVLTLSHRNKLLPMIESEADNSLGTIYYALAMSVMAAICLFLPDMILPFGIGVFCTSLGDGFAGLMGQLINTPSNGKIYGNKTIYGTLFNFLVCFIATGVFQKEFGLGFQTWQIIAIAILATELELFTDKGLDNVSVTLGTSFLSYFFIVNDRSGNYIVPILLTPLIIAFAYKKKALSFGGIIAAIIVDLLITISFGNFGFCILLSFFVGGIIVDEIKKSSRKTGQNKWTSIEKRGESRDSVQVLANSLVATICAILYLLTDEKVFVVAFVASLAEAFADTAASGIGVASGRAYDLFRLRPCQPGISGGMSLLGTAASVIAALLICIFAYCFDQITLTQGVIILISSVLGAIFDSFLGSVLQIKYKCTVCDEIVEREEHCNKPTVKHSGVVFVNNDTVNLLGTLFSAAVSSVFYIIM